MTLGVLARNETLKTRKRPAAMVTAGLFTAMLGIMMFETIREHAKHPERLPLALPTAWSDLINDPAVPAAFFAAILLILLVSSEFSWRTARQNVIDGLSKDQWFGGKLMLWAMVVVGFFALHISVVGGATIATGGVTGPIVRVGDAQLMGAELLAIGGVTSLGFFVAFLARSSGPAMAILFFYLAVLEQLLGAGLRHLGGAWAKAAGFLPMRLFSELIEPARYDAAAYEKMVATLTKANRPIPALDDTGLLAAVATAEIVFFLMLAYLVYRRRDL